MLEERTHFLALEPAPSAMEVFESLQHHLQRDIRVHQISWTKDDAWMIKLHQLGTLSTEQEEELMDGLELLPRTGLSLVCWQLALQPSMYKGRKLILRFSDPTGEVFARHHALYPILLRAGLQVDTHPWNPHLVLGHVPLGRTEAHIDLSTIHAPQYTFRLTHLSLIESRRGGGPRYTDLYSLPLQSP